LIRDISVYQADHSIFYYFTFHAILNQISYTYYSSFSGGCSQLHSFFFTCYHCIYVGFTSPSILAFVCNTPTNYFNSIFDLLHFLMVLYYHNLTTTLSENSRVLTLPRKSVLLEHSLIYYISTIDKYTIFVSFNNIFFLNYLSISFFFFLYPRNNILTYFSDVSSSSSCLNFAFYCARIFDYVWERKHFFCLMVPC